MVLAITCQHLLTDHVVPLAALVVLPETSDIEPLLNENLLFPRLVTLVCELSETLLVPIVGNVQATIFPVLLV